MLNVEWVFLLHFPREFQGAHEGYPDGVPGRYSGPNATIQQLYGRVALIVSTIFGIPHAVAYAWAIQKIAVFNILSIDGPKDQAKKESEDNETYKAIRVEADPHSRKLIRQAFGANLPLFVARRGMNFSKVMKVSSPLMYMYHRTRRLPIRANLLQEVVSSYPKRKQLNLLYPLLKS